MIRRAQLPVHIPEPWRVVQGTKTYIYIAAADRTINGAYVGIVYDEANARRIIACVNACAGISTEALEGGAKVAELVGAAKEHLEVAPCQNNCPKWDKDCTANGLMAILAKFEGKP